MSNKFERRTKGEYRYKNRLKRLGLKGNNYYYKQQAKPCSCPVCSPGKRKQNGEAKRVYKIISGELNMHFQTLAA